MLYKTNRMYCIALLIGALITSSVSQTQCAEDCTVKGVPTGSYAGWVVMDDQDRPRSRTITAITVVTIINTDLGTTRTTEIFDADKLSIPINSQGTQIRNVTYTVGGRAVVTEIAYPTFFKVVPQQWKWYGVMSTLNSAGQLACVSVNTSSARTFSVDYYSQSPVNAETTDSRDPRGWDYKPDNEGHRFATEVGQEATWEPALTRCWEEIVLPINNQALVAYGTFNSVSYEGASPNSAISPGTQILSSPVSSIGSRTLSEGISESGASVLLASSPSTATGNPSRPELSASSQSRDGVKTTTTRTVVSDGPGGPTTVVETLETTTATTQNGGSKKRASYTNLLFCWTAAMCLSWV